MTHEINWYAILAGAVAGFSIDLAEWYEWRKRNPGTKYDYQLAFVRVLVGMCTGFIGGNATQVVGNLL